MHTCIPKYKRINIAIEGRFPILVSGGGGGCSDGGGAWEGRGCDLAFTRYCNCQYCMVFVMHNGVWWGVVYCPKAVQ